MKQARQPPPSRWLAHHPNEAKITLHRRQPHPHNHEPSAAARMQPITTIPIKNAPRQNNKTQYYFYTPPPTFILKFGPSSSTLHDQHHQHHAAQFRCIYSYGVSHTCVEYFFSQQIHLSHHDVFQAWHDWEKGLGCVILWCRICLSLDMSFLRLNFSLLRGSSGFNRIPVIQPIVKRVHARDDY